METWSGCIPPWWRPSRIWRAMPDALIPNEIDRRDARSWVSNPTLKMMTQSSLRRPLKYLPMSLVYATRDDNKQSSQPFRTLFLQETIKRGILAPSLIVSYAHKDSDIDKTVEVIHEALYIYRKALDEGVKKYLIGRSVKPVWRRFN